MLLHRDMLCHPLMRSPVTLSCEGEPTSNSSESPPRDDLSVLTLQHQKAHEPSWP